MDNDPVTPCQVVEYLHRHQLNDKYNSISILISKRTTGPTKILIQHHWDTFRQIQPVPLPDSLLHASITLSLPKHSSTTKEPTLVMPISDDPVHNEVQDIIEPSLMKNPVLVIYFLQLKEVVPTRKSSGLKLRPRVPTRLKLHSRVDYKKLSTSTVLHVLLQDSNDYIDDKKSF